MQQVKADYAPLEHRSTQNMCREPMHIQAQLTHLRQRRYLSEMPGYFFNEIVRCDVFRPLP